ncbi:neutral cholesterol ester hydrolase 1 isoform X1 [Electrophorus electricus]|uniref:neutral cholesterol ester hydrolase 1 isoform X1 n=1 Tax=Electrophorus electricus TaxID=8005 RepID=UPI0015CF9F4C|nr:neutral cholesterol ester hydrolase 1 isoform X1 [Electrophorus electricus]
MMRSILFTAVLLSVAASYYIYLPLPSTITEPWKLMLLDAVFRCMMHVGNLIQDLGLCHHVRVLNFVVSVLELRGPRSSEFVRVTDTSFSGVPARVFESIAPGPERLKRGVIYFHGGGWALGSGRMRSYDLLCRKMAEELDAVIISVDYKLAPDAHFPEQYDDALSACRHILKAEVLASLSMDPERVAVSGDSAGGNLAAAVTQQLAVDTSVSVRLKAQALVYPVLQALDFNTPSYQQNSDVPILYRPLMARFWLEYLSGDLSLVPYLLANNHTALDQSQEAEEAWAKVNWTRLLAPTFHKHYKPVVPRQGTPRLLEQLPGLLDVRAAPLLAEGGVLEKVPPAYILTCEHDVLRDDGLMYAQRLEEAGVAVTSDHYEEGFHGCMVFAFWPVCFSVGKRSLRNYISWLEQNL